MTVEPEKVILKIWIILERDFFPARNPGLSDDWIEFYVESPLQFDQNFCTAISLFYSAILSFEW